MGRTHVSGLGEGQLPLVAQIYLRDQEGRRLRHNQAGIRQPSPPTGREMSRVPQGLIPEMAVLKVHVCWGV